MDNNSQFETNNKVHPTPPKNAVQQQSHTIDICKYFSYYVT